MKRFRFFVVIVCTLLAACVSPRKGAVDMEAQRRVWTERMNEVFPAATQDTVELKRRLDYYLQTGNKSGQALMYRVLGVQSRYASQFRRAIEQHNEGLRIAREIADTVNITILLNDLATDFRRIGAYNEALPYSFLALQTAEQYRGPDTLPIRRNMASALNGIGNIYLPMEEYEPALAMFERALELEIGQGNDWGIAVNQANIGSIHFSRGDWERAEQYYRESIRSNERANLPVGIALCRINIGNIYQAQGRLDDALGEYTEAYNALKDSTDQLHWLDVCFDIANIHLIEGRDALAARFLEEGLTGARRINSIQHLARAYGLYARYNYDRGDFRRSADEMRLAQAYNDTIRQNRETSRMLESRIQYETDRYTRQIEEMDSRNRVQTERQRMAMMIMVTIALGLGLLALFSYSRRRLERRAADELKGLERMRSNFFTNITHELRTPITVINGLADHLRTELGEGRDGRGERHERDLEAIRRQGGHLNHLVNQLLEFSRSEAGIDRPKWRCGDLVEYLRVVAEPYARYARSRDVDLVVYSEVESLVTNFAPSSLKKVMANLLSNAIRHCAPGANIVVHFRATGAGAGAGAGTSGAGADRCTIRVKDTGEGIPAGSLPHIFNLYYTSASGRADSTGSGIGLALSKQLVEEIGGTIGVESTPGRGAEFTVTLPVSLAPIPESEREQLDEDIPPEADISPREEPETKLENSVGSGGGTGGTGGTGGGAKKTILVVEDSRDVAHYISTILEGRYRMIYAADGGEGLLAAERHIPDLIITDVMMPGRDGFQFTAELRASVAVSHIPVIMVTALGTTEDKLEGLRAGADAYLAKPFDERELLARVKQLLDSRAMLMETYSDALFRAEKGGGGPVASLDQNMAFITRLSLAVNAHLADEGWFPDGLCSEMCLSESQLGRKLKAMTGHTISSFVMRARLNKAKQLLARRDRTIKEVAYACGFADLSYFSRSFRKVFGYTPSEFLKIPLD